MVGSGPVIEGRAFAWMWTTRAGVVDPALDASRDGHGGHFEGEAQGHSCDRPERNFEVSEERVENVADH